DRERSGKHALASEARRPPDNQERLRIPIRSPTHKSHPDTGGGKFDEGEVVGIVFFETGGDGSKMLDLVEEPLDEIAIAIKEGAEGRIVDAARHGLDVGPGAAGSEGLAQSVTVIGAVSEQDLARADAVEHVGGAPAVMSLTFGELERDRVAVGIDEGVDFRRQPAPRAPHASGSREV